MKKVKSLILLGAVIMLATGCMKFNANMDIKKDKSMDFSIIYAVNSSLIGDEELIKEEDKKELEEKGFIVSDYNDGKMKGFNITQKIKNIDEVSSESDVEFSLSGLLKDENNEDKVFKIKKGLLKNTYTAKFKFDASDSDFGNSLENSYGSSSSLFEDDDTDSLSLDDENNTDSNFDFGDMDFSGMMSNLDLSFNVSLPYAAKSNNASTTNNDNKNLSWNLSINDNNKMIEFEFELYNMTIIYIGAGALALLIVLIVVIIVRKNKGRGNVVLNKVDENIQANVNGNANPNVEPNILVEPVNPTLTMQNVGNQNNGIPTVNQIPNNSDMVNNQQSNPFNNGNI